MKYMRCEGMQAMYQSFIVRMAVAHAHFEAVHPSRDGNGRIGRLLSPLMMAAEGMMPIYLWPYIEAHLSAEMATARNRARRMTRSRILISAPDDTFAGKMTAT